MSKERLGDSESEMDSTEYDEVVEVYDESDIIKYYNKWMGHEDEILKRFEMVSMHDVQRL